MPSVYLRVDTSDLDNLLDEMRSVLTEAEARKVLVRVLSPGRVGSKIKTILVNTLPAEYYAKPGWIRKAVGPAKFSGGSTVSCVIPLDGARGPLGDVFSVSGSSGGKGVRSNWEGRKGQKTGKGKRRQRKVTITANIVKSGASTLPATMAHQGGQPPFMLFGGGGVYTRTTKARYPIARVVGLALPQMPLNRSEPAVQDAIHDYMEERMLHECQQLLGRFG